MHIIDNPKCLCGSAIESPKHYFQECPRYVGPRQILYTKISEITAFQININTLLFGHKELSLFDNLMIFKAVHTYIKETKRFSK